MFYQVKLLEKKGKHCLFYSSSDKSRQSELAVAKGDGAMATACQHIHKLLTESKHQQEDPSPLTYKVRPQVTKGDKVRPRLLRGMER